MPANMCFFMLTNPMLVILKKLKLSLKRLKIKSLRKTKKHKFPLAFALNSSSSKVTFGQNPNPLFGVVFFQTIWFWFLKVKVKVDLSMFKLRFLFPPKYFQVLREKQIQNPFIWKTLKFGRKTIVWSSYTGHSNIWTKSGSVVRLCLFPRQFDFEFKILLSGKH